MTLWQKIRTILIAVFLVLLGVFLIAAARFDYSVFADIEGLDPSLAELFRTIQAWSFFSMSSRFSIFIPVIAGAMKSSTAQRMLPMVSPVITAVGGASPKPDFPLSEIIFKFNRFI